MNKIVEERKILRYETIGGKQVPVYSAKAEITITNTRTGQTYSSEDECKADIDNSETETTNDDIRRDVVITAPAIVSGSVAGKK